MLEINKSQMFTIAQKLYPQFFCNIDDYEFCYFDFLNTYRLYGLSRHLSYSFDLHFTVDNDVIDVVINVFQTEDCEVLSSKLVALSKFSFQIVSDFVSEIISAAELDKTLEPKKEEKKDFIIAYEQPKYKIYKIIDFYTHSLSNIDDYFYEYFIVSFDRCYCYRLSKLLFDDVYVRYELSVSSDCSTLECYIVNELECFSTVFRIDLNAAEVEDLLK